MRMRTRLATHSDVWSEVVSAEKAARSRAGQILLAVAGLEDCRRHGRDQIDAALAYYRDCCARLDAAYARGGFGIEPFDFDSMDWGNDEPEA
ncbi:hypothetical protein HFN59_21930 [Rhizobium leguminosarum]|uniref:hypothetical protein n=1 Tax=Rhizobium leguminosarum TaxID=384 RepID=UPI001C969115|nr:hypothetical protein [Rhizobium leguminosarum]MBY5779734.1 hypothetical protein [Rhizobium leguminosarum]